MTKLSPPDASNVHNGSKPVFQSSSSNQESFNGSKENDLKTDQANLTSMTESGPNSLDRSRGEDSSYATEGPPNPVTSLELTFDVASHANKHDLTVVTNRESSNPVAEQSKPGSVNSGDAVSSGDRVQAHVNTTDSPVLPQTSDCDVPRVGRALHHSQELKASDDTHVYVHPAASQNPNSEPAGGNVIISESRLIEEENVADSLNQEPSVAEAAAAAVSACGVHEDQEINASTSGTLNEATHVNQEGTASTAAVAAAAAIPPPPPEESQNLAGETVPPLQNDNSFASLTPHPIQEDGENTDTCTEGPTHIETPQEQEGTANTEGVNHNETAVQEEVGNRYNNLLGK